MSVMHPVGPQSPTVYWIRRVVVLVVLVLVLALVGWLLFGRGGGGADGASPSTSPTTSPSTSPSSSPSASKSPKPSKSDSSSDSSSSSSGAASTNCKDSQISVVASTDAESYPVGASPKLKMRITNTSTTGCLRDVGSPANELIVNQGSTRFWSSDDCSPGGDSDVVTLEPNESYSVTLTWPEVGSSEGCPSASPVAATPGSYTLVGRNGEVYSSPAKFTLTS